MKIDTLLHEEIQNEFGELKRLAVGTEEYKITVDGITKLMDRAIEIDKLENDHKEKVANRESEMDLKIQQMEDEKKDRRIKNFIAVFGIGVPTLLTIWGTKKSIQFEKEGTFTTIMGRGFINRLLPKK